MGKHELFPSPCHAEATKEKNPMSRKGTKLAPPEKKDWEVTERFLFNCSGGGTH